MKHWVKILLIVAAFSALLLGCAEKNGIESESEVTHEIVSEDTVSTSETIIEETEQQTTIQISETSEVKIINSIEDGTLWLTEKDEQGQSYVVRANVYGEVLAKANRNNFDGYPEIGIDERLFFTTSNQIYDVFSLENVSSTYIGDYDEIVSCLSTENGPVFVVRKVTDSFEEKYASLGLVDKNGQVFFEISLDSNAMQSKYGIETIYETTKETTYSTNKIEIEYAGNDVYYIGYIGMRTTHNEPNSLIVDLNRNSIIPVDFPNPLNGLYCSSDGVHTMALSRGHEHIVIDNETGECSDFSDPYHSPSGVLSEGLFCARGNRYGNDTEVRYMDASGNLVIDLNNYSQTVKQAWPFEKGIALIEFENEYVTFIDTNGDFLFDPVKGGYAKYFENEGIALITVDDGSDAGQHFSVNTSGKVQEISISDRWLSNDDYHLVEYEGQKYWVMGGNSGLQMQPCE